MLNDTQLILAPTVCLEMELECEMNYQNADSGYKT